MNDASLAASLRSLWHAPLQASGPFPVMAFSHSGSLIATGTSSRDQNGSSLGSLAVFDAGTGAPVGPGTDDGWQINGLAFSRDDQWLASSESQFRSSDAAAQIRLRIVDARTLAERCQFPGVLEQAPTHLAFSGDGSWVMGAVNEFIGTTRRVFAFDVTDVTERWRHLFPDMGDVALSPDSAAVAVATSGAVVILNAADRDKPDLTIPVPAAGVPELAYSPDGRRIAVGGHDGTVQVFDAGTGAALWPAPVVTAPGASVSQLAISADSRWLAVSVGVKHTSPPSLSGLLCVFDLEQGKPRFTPVDFVFPGKMLFSPALRDLVYSVPYGNVPDLTAHPAGFCVVDARTGSLRASAPAKQSSVDVSPDGTTIAATGDPVAAIYDSGLLVSSLTVGAKPTALAISSVGTPLVAVAEAGTADATPAVTVCTAADGHVEWSKPVPGAITDVVFADHGRAVAAGSSTGVRLFSVAGDQSWKAETIGLVNALAAVGPGDWIAVAAGRTVRLLNSTDGHERWAAPNTHPLSVTRVEASPDGAWIATGCADRTTRILDAATGMQKFSVSGDGTIRAIAFQPGQTLLGTANQDGTIVLVDAAAAAERGRISRPVGCARIAFGSDPATLAAAWDDNTVTVYDISAAGTPPKLSEFTVTAPVTALAVNPSDGTVVASIADGTSVAARDPHSGIELVRFLHSAPVIGAAISADGALVATTCADNIVRVWRSGAAPPDQPPT